MIKQYVTWGAIWGAMALLPCAAQGSSSYQVPQVPQVPQEHHQHVFQQLNTFLSRDKVKTQAALLYRFMKIVDNILQANDIPYWIEAGTLLGAVRHKSLIPWDDDLDIAVDVKDEPKIKTLGPQFKEHGIEFYKMPDGRYVARCVFRQGDNRYFLYIDIYLRQRDPHSNVWGYVDANSQAAWPMFSFHHHDVMPLKNYPFGPITVLGPHNPWPYLNQGYKNWTEEAYLDSHFFTAQETQGMHKEKIPYTQDLYHSIQAFNQQVQDLYPKVALQPHEHWGENVPAQAEETQEQKN